jgi:hypothetical protein
VTIILVKKYSQWHALTVTSHSPEGDWKRFRKKGSGHFNCGLLTRKSVAWKFLRIFFPPIAKKKQKKRTKKNKKKKKKKK